MSEESTDSLPHPLPSIPELLGLLVGDKGLEESLNLNCGLDLSFAKIPSSGLLGPRQLQSRGPRDRSRGPRDRSRGPRDREGGEEGEGKIVKKPQVHKPVDLIGKC